MDLLLVLGARDHDVDVSRREAEAVAVTGGRDRDVGREAFGALEEVTPASRREGDEPGSSVATTVPAAQSAGFPASSKTRSVG